MKMTAAHAYISFSLCLLCIGAEHEVQYVTQEALHLVETHRFV